MKTPKFSSDLAIGPYLTKIRSIAFPQVTDARIPDNQFPKSPKISLVLGNPSCDLDSFISACVLSYFYNTKRVSEANAPVWIPLLNLPDVPSNDLWRLRPEFGAALSSAVGGVRSSKNDESHDGYREESTDTAKTLLERLITIHDLQNHQSTIPELKEAFRNSKSTQYSPQEVILVDHNAPTVPGLDDEVVRSRLSVTGCIDHHVDEEYVSKSASPRIITTGIGSCTSLVVKYLRDNKLWQDAGDHSHQIGEEQMAKLAMASILIDTTNLTATGDKCSDTDREAIAFLQQHAGNAFDRDVLFAQTSKAKSESLNLLKMSEIFSRDYKEWTESSTKANETGIAIGISSLVKSFGWLSKHAGGSEALVKEMVDFAQDRENKLGVFCMLTRAGERKEIAIISFNDQGKQGIHSFETAAKELDLQEWNEDSDLTEALNTNVSNQTGGYWKIWWMGDVSKSRKQVGPLLRTTVREAK